MLFTKVNEYLQYLMINLRLTNHNLYCINLIYIYGSF